MATTKQQIAAYTPEQRRVVRGNNNQTPMGQARFLAKLKKAYGPPQVKTLSKRQKGCRYINTHHRWIFDALKPLREKAS